MKEAAEKSVQAANSQMDEEDLDYENSEAFDVKVDDEESEEESEEEWVKSESEWLPTC